MPVQRLAEHAPYLRALFYGLTGVGKTTMIASALDVPNFCPVLFIDADKGTLSIRERANDPNLYYWPLGPYGEMNDILAIIANFKAYKEARPEEELPDIPFRTILFDDLSEIYWKALDMVIAERYKRRPESDPITPEQGDYGKARLLMHKLLRTFKGYDVHFLAAAPAAQVRDGMTGRLEIGLDAIGKLSDEMPGHFDFIGYITVAQHEDHPRGLRRMTFQPISKLRAKDRATELEGSTIDEPTVTKIVNAAPHVPFEIQSKGGDTE